MLFLNESSKLIPYKVFNVRGYNWNVVLINDKTVYEAYLQADNYGIINFMFGCLKKDCTFEHFKELVESNLFDYVESYLMQFVDDYEEEC